MRNVLLSNDDGIHSPGLRALADAFLQDGWRVCVCAPDGERSAAAHSITIKRPLVVTEIKWTDVAENAPLTVYTCDGTPADCVKVALLSLLERKPDVVVSGINNGWNAGTDVHYSGTVGAAMEAAFEGAQGIAVSVSHPDRARNENAAMCAVGLARRLVEAPLDLPAILNLNLPDCPPEAIRGLVEAPLSAIRYTDAYDHLPRGRGRGAYWLKGEIVEESALPGGDLERLLHGYATVTAVGWDLSLRGACTEILQD